MKVVMGARQSGKTTLLLEYMERQRTNHGIRIICLCVTPEESMRLLRLARDLGYGLYSWQFLSFEEARTNRHVFRGRDLDTTRIAIDNADYIFKNYLIRTLPMIPSLVTWNLDPPHGDELLITSM